MRIELTTRVIFARVNKSNFLMKIAEAKRTKSIFISLEVQRDTLYGSGVPGSGCSSGFEPIDININHIVYYKE